MVFEMGGLEALTLRNIMLCYYWGGVLRFNSSKFVHFSVPIGKILCLMRRKEFSTRHAISLPAVTVIEGSAHDCSS